jgi:hypothetical protein
MRELLAIFETSVMIHPQSCPLETGMKILKNCGQQRIACTAAAAKRVAWCAGAGSTDPSVRSGQDGAVQPGDRVRGKRRQSRVRRRTTGCRLANIQAEPSENDLPRHSMLKRSFPGNDSFTF